MRWAIFALVAGDGVRQAQSSGWLAAGGGVRRKSGIRTSIGRRLPKIAKIAKMARARSHAIFGAPRGEFPATGFPGTGVAGSRAGGTGSGAASAAGPAGGRGGGRGGGGPEKRR